MTDLVRVNILAEGQTEETFVRDLLREPMASHGVYVAVRCVMSGRRGGRTYRGGMTTYARARNDIKNWLSEDRSAHLTTMFDLYRLPADFPGIDRARTLRDPCEKVRHLEAELAADIQEPRFIPYIQLHEFEGLLFSDVRAIAAVLMVYHQNRSEITALQEIRVQFHTPEEIDDDETTAPSKRLKSLYTAYDKVAFGPRIAERIGLDTLRRECPHFGEWLSKLESLACR